MPLSTLAARILLYKVLLSALGMLLIFRWKELECLNPPSALQGMPCMSTPLSRGLRLHGLC